ncbi:sigma-70 family RNA polymerase sigma factor [Paenibacillus profundus]|uniref:Sigma-70 family RNA polymerase sigma factor n=1 Tax=Paenibacillus profundus TaxID=1173085 RepID=A0ABS8YG49_9BACL|nr:MULTISPECIES: sigma-70 family RNA polymerase sigma factor [Paenibacillus]MCE5169087.1 sigma-70 family RNA polymerase sigma factor [Paenibacillus profundus]
MQQLEHEVERVRQGDKDAFGTLIRAHEASLYRIAKSIVSSDEDCADAIQEAVLKAYRSIHTLREPRYFKTWLVRILVNECRSILRKRKQTVPFIELQHARAEEDDYMHIETQEIVDSLEEDLRIVVTLFYIEDLPLKEVADMLDQPIGTVKSRLYRARQKLAELLNVTNGSGKELTT